MEHFCDNGMCPHHNLEMNQEKHYHSGDDRVVGGICGVLKTHSIRIKLEERIEKKKFRFYRFINEIEYKSKIKEYHFCDICYTVAILLKGIDYE